MKLNRCHVLLFVLLVASSATLKAQDRFSRIEQELEALKMDVAGLDEKIEISVDEVELEEFLRGIALANKLNISVDPTLDLKITNNFVDVTVSDILVFLARKYKLDIQMIGSIITIAPFEEVPVDAPVMKRVTYQGEDNSISLDFQNVPLNEVLKEITSESKKNVIADVGLEQQKISAYILNMPFDNAIEKFAMANNLEMTLSGDGFYILSKKDIAVAKSMNQRASGNFNSGNFEFSAVDPNSISVSATETPISDIFRAVSNSLGINYYMLTVPSSNTSLNIRDFSYSDFLDHLFKATAYTYREMNDIYLIGDRKIEDLRATRVVELQHRSVENIIEHIPAEIKTGVTIKEFNDLNSLVLSGSEPNINEIEYFLRSIDKVVPVVLIEVMIIDYSSGHTTSTGVRAGIGEDVAPPSSGQLYPSVNYSLNSNSVNNLVESLNGFGWFKLGKVTPNFYLTIQALEDQGILKVRSTPKLATLNGNEATLSVGNTEYYAVESNNVIGSQNPQNIITRTYQSVNADLTVTIKPFVSGDEQITLDISVEQSDFTARVSPDAPPGSVTRSFSSLVRVKNEEMILLGGLEQKSIEDSGTGTPLLARIPIIKYLFSTRTRSRKSDKLNIFIKPTVFY
ncbi:MAG: type II and III secretion system protein [Vicingaceae bacterium]